MGEYFIKKEGDKEVVYEKGIFGTEIRVGDLHKKLGGSKETRNAFSPNIQVERENWVGERKSSIDGKEGVFSKDTFLGVELRGSPSFKPKPEESCEVDGGVSSPSYGLEERVSSSSSGFGWFISLIIAGAIAYSVITTIKEYDQVKQNRSNTEYSIPYQEPRGGTHGVERELPITRKSKQKVNKSNKKENKEILPKENENKRTLEVVVEGEVSKIYESILPSSEFARSTPKGYAPVVTEKRRLDMEGNVISSEKVLEYKPKKELEEFIGAIGINYPKTGNWYSIDESKYPEFYEVSDLNGDGKVSAYETGQTQVIFNEITAKYTEGDVDSIVKEFVRVMKKRK